MTNPRVAKLADQIHVIVAEMLERRVKDPRLGFVAITDVRLTGDTREATIFYTVMGDDKARNDSAAALKSATGLIRSEVAKRLGLKFAPTIAFMLDATPEAAKNIEDLLAQAKLRDDQLHAEAAGKTYAGEADPYRRDDEDDQE